MHVVFAIGAGAPQVVDVGGRDGGQSLIVGLVVDLEFAFENTTHGRAREAFVRRVDRGQASDIVGRVAAWEAAAAGSARLDDAALAPTGDQAGDLRQAESADLGQIAAHNPLVFLRQTRVPAGAQGAFEQRVNLLAAGAGKAEGGAGVEKLFDLDRREMFGMLHGNRHSPAVCPVSPLSFSGSSCIGNTPSFRLILCWTILPRSSGRRLLYNFQRVGLSGRGN